MSSQLVQLQPVYIKVDGADLPDQWFDLLEMVEVDLTLGAPDMVTLSFSDSHFILVDDALFAHGKKIEVSAKDGNGTASVMATVEVASLEPDFRADGSARFVVRGYGKWNRLQNGRKCKTFQDMKDSDIASSIAGAAGLTSDVTATTVVYKYLVQWQQTDMEFLLERAERIGFEVYQEAEKLVFKPAPTTMTEAFTFAYGESLNRFQPRFSVAGQLNTIKVFSWDAATKDAVAGEASPAGVQGGMGKTGAAEAQSAFGQSVTEVVTDGSVISASEANERAKAIASSINGEYFEADGACEGSPGLLPGKIIKIDNVGTRFSGKYRVTGVRHTFNQDGMSTQFTVLGRNGGTLAQAMHAPAPRRRIDGLMVGIVTNLADPDGTGRVRVKFPTLMGNTDPIESFWARVAMPMAGPQTGMMFYPEINEEVLVGFEDGDPAHAVIVGALGRKRQAAPCRRRSAREWQDQATHYQDQGWPRNPH